MNLASSAARVSFHLPGPALPTAPQRFVVVEDEAEIRDAIVSALVADGSHATGLSAGPELVGYLNAVVRHSRLPPDVITLDVYMPGGTGIELLERLRREGCQIPIVLITGFASQELRTRAARAGSAAVIEKPFQVNELRSAAVRARTSLPVGGPRL